ncbi:MAG: preprotein translocase subunit SecF, partial [Pseudonocardiales bacterium]|nr:preprotein translocase subunit SecF [Pseudonocardiales bacterium]
MAHPENGLSRSEVRSTRGNVFSRLYTGTGAFNIVGNRKRWYLVFGSLVLICIASMVFRGFSLGIEFEGGTQIQFSTVGITGDAS